MMKQFTIYALSAFCETEFDVFVIVTRINPLEFTFANQSSVIVEGNTVSGYIEFDESVWQNEVLPTLKSLGVKGIAPSE